MDLRYLAIAVLLSWAQPARAESPLIRAIEHITPLAAPDAETMWSQARAAVVPVDNSAPRIIITLQKVDRQGTHMYHGLSAMWSDNGGQTWTQPTSLNSVDRIAHTNGLWETPVDMTPQFHQQSGKLLLTGATFWQDPKLKRDVPHGPSHTAYAVYDPQTDKWGTWKKLVLPDDPKFHFARAGCTQRLDLPNGDIFLPMYFHGKGSVVNYATVVRCKFDGEVLLYQEHGTELTAELTVTDRRTGLYEPSLTKFGNRYLLTLRGDQRAYLATSVDGLNYDEPQPWRFDNGEELGSYNTQQHWITHSDGLFLAYTRRGAGNDNVFRHRAPLFIAEVDPENLTIKRRTELLVLPNLGLPFGNFGVCNVSPQETWVVDCLAGAKPTAANLYIAKIHWSRPNRR